MNHDFYKDDMEAAEIDAGNCFFPASGDPNGHRGFVVYRDTVGREWFVINQSTKKVTCAKRVVLVHCDDDMEYMTCSRPALAYDDEERVLLFDARFHSYYHGLPVIFQSK